MKRFTTFVEAKQDPAPQGDRAYRGYLIRFNPLNGLCWIEKDGTRISYAKDVADAQSIIDSLVAEDVAANCAGAGAVAGLGVGPKGEPGIALPRRKKKLDETVTPDDTFAGTPVFDVGMDKMMNIKGPKHPRHRYAKYVGADEVGENIRQHGRSKTGDIIVREKSTAIMTYLRRKPVKG